MEADELRSNPDWPGGICLWREEVTVPVTVRRDLLDDIDTVVWEGTPDGGVRFINHRATELFGYPAERWLSEAGFWRTITHPGDRADAAMHLSRCVTLRQNSTLEYRILAADGRVVWVREALRAARGEDSDGRVRGVMWTVGGRRRAERHLYAARQELADQLADMTYLNELTQRLWATRDVGPLVEEILTAALSIVGAEVGMFRLYDSPSDELVIAASVALPEAFLARYDRIPACEAFRGAGAETGGPFLIEDLEITEDVTASRDAGRAGGYRARCVAPVKSRDGRLLGTITACFREPHRPAAPQVDLLGTFARQAADFLENAQHNAALHEADHRKDRFLAVLAHELRNPLSVILNAAHSFDLENNGDGANRDARDLIVRQAQLMAQLASDLIDASRLARDENPLKLAVVDVGKMIASAAEAIRPLLRDRNHELTTVAPADSLLIDADPMRIEQILVNLLANACRYTKPGGKIRLEACREGDEVVIRVRDTGIGIAREMLGRIFDPFVQGRREPGRSAEGLGLGLALVKGLAERHGGTVSASSDGPGQGSQFTVRLPAGRGAVAAPSAADHPANGRAAAVDGLDVLVVDDQPDLARSLARLIESWGHRTRIAHDGAAALEQLEHRCPEVVFLDIALPDADGHDVARRMRQMHGAGLTIVAMTGFEPGTDREQDDALFDGYLTKPVSPEDLRSPLERPRRPSGGIGPR